jgi:16S rRNA (uracil1498-N3)-methyltransferase
MILFYASQIREDRSWAVFDQDESRHMIQSLRLQAGAIVHFTDGNGHYYQGTIITPDKRETVVSIHYKEEKELPRPEFHLAVSPLKHHERLEWLVEKAVEIGVTSMSFPICHRTERPGVRIDRLQRIALSAMKQSLRFYIPMLQAGIVFDEVVNLPFPGQKLIAYIDETPSSLITEVIQPKTDTFVLIGPEGDFTKDEIIKAEQMGFQKISLGHHRLRTETAALYAAAVFKSKNEE